MSDETHTYTVTHRHTLDVLSSTGLLRDINYKLT